MSQHLTQLRSRGRRYVGVFAGLAMGAAAVLVPAGAASAGPANLPPLPDDAKQFAVPFDKHPAGSVRATHSPFAPGAHGSAFQSTAKAPTGRPRVVGGTPANAADFPGVVGIQSMYIGLDENGNEGWYISTCTGSVLTSTKVLTAGHCAVDLPYGTTMVIAGRNDLNVDSGGYVARVATTWTHQGFNLGAMYQDPTLVPVDDVSVLTLKDALPDVYTPVSLSAQGDEAPYAADTEAVIAGYGMTEPSGGQIGVLHQAKVPMTSASDCVAAYGSKVDGNRMVCAGNPAQGIDTCHGDSGGPIFVGGVQVGITDWGNDPCASTYGVYEKLSYYSTIVKEDLTRSGLINLDWTGDGHSDLFGRYSNGDLLIGTGSGLASDGYGGFSYFGMRGTGWGSYTKLFRVYNWNGDGNPSIMGRDAAGMLYQWKSDGQGNFVDGRALIGSGWNAFTDIMVTNNWMGDGRPNVMARKANGDLMIYTSNGSGGWLNPHGTKIGSGWSTFDTVLTPGSWLGDGRQSLIGRKANGELWLYNNNGTGGFSGTPTKIGTGWNTFKIFLSPGDWSGDNLIDLVGINAAGSVRLYTSNGKGGWIDGRGKEIDSGWNVFNTVF